LEDQKRKSNEKLGARIDPDLRRCCVHAKKFNVLLVLLEWPAYSFISSNAINIPENPIWFSFKLGD